jgi:hypothetical protein
MPATQGHAQVKNGRVQKKHRHRPTATLGYVIDRESPAKGCRHVLTKTDIRRFTALIPGWGELVHELGHHVDRMESKAQDRTRRGERFAESYANRLGAEQWPEYLRVFGDLRRSG